MLLGVKIFFSIRSGAALLLVVEGFFRAVAEVSLISV
jgi:hypothetical protein